ncbi:hypothetical protein ACQ4PT_063760 [Festuca glaucescens]
MDVVAALWDGTDDGEVVPSDPLARLGFKLRRVSRGLQGWSQRKVGSIRDLLLVANEVILRLDVAQEARELSVIEVWLRRSLKLKVLGLASLERTIARQRARVEGLRDNDASTQFYRILASGRRQRCCISALRMGERTATDLAGKVALATEYYVDLLGTARPRDFDLSLEALGLQPVGLAGLEARFTEEEVWAALCAMPSNKSPGPDGFTWEFYRHCWPLIKADVMAALLEIWMGRHQGFEDLNEALITLVPKREGAFDLKDFRPISLVYSFARLLTKVLARRLAPAMTELVSPNQTAFIRGRCIHDNFLLVKESAKLLHRKRIPSLLLKVDMAKAFDTISWPFLLSVLRQRGFGPRWIGWIALLLRTASTSVLVNGVAGDAFRHGRGLRQGDPIPPLLFVIAMEVLPALFSATVRAGLLSDLAAVGLRHRVSLYADDVVVFAKPGREELAAVWGVLRCFGATSGLLVNYQKSSAAPICCSPEDVVQLSTTLPCPATELPCTYLGLPLSLRKPRKEDLQDVLDKLAARLPFWKARLMSREGRVVYIQAVMTSSLIYHLLALDLDPWFFRAVDKLRRGFLWLGKEDANGGCCSVAWRLVCQPKSLGGLGLLDLRRMNTALRSRWIWFQKTEATKPWSGLDLQVGPDSWALFNASVQIVVGDGKSVLFWEDPWIAGLTASAIAPELIKLVKPAVRKRRSVRDGLAHNAWVFDIAGELSVDATVQYMRLWEAVHGVAVVCSEDGGADSFRWKWSGDGSFSSRAAYRMLFHGCTGLAAAPLIWASFAPLKHRFHAWLALRRRCWTANRRLRRGLPTHTLCPLCDSVDETIDHISLHCDYAKGIWHGLVQRLHLPDIVLVENLGIGDWWIQASSRFAAGTSGKRGFRPGSFGPSVPVFKPGPTRRD